MTDPSRCQKSIWRSGGFRGYSEQCARKPVKDGWCTQHHPDTIKARRTEQQRQDNLRRVESEQRWRREKAVAAVTKPFSTEELELLGGRISDIRRLLADPQI